MKHVIFHHLKQLLSPRLKLIMAILRHGVARVAFTGLDT